MIAVLSLTTLAVAVSAPAAQAGDGCRNKGGGDLTCWTTVDGGELSISFAQGRVSGFYNAGRAVHLDRRRPDGSWDGPLAGGRGSTSKELHGQASWRACGQARHGAYGCTDWHTYER